MKDIFNFSPETIQKMAIYLIAALVYGVRMESKLNQHGEILNNIQQESKQAAIDRKSEEREKEMELKVMEAEIHTLDLRTSLLEQQLKDSQK